MGSTSALPLTICVTLGKCLTISEPLFPYRKHGRRPLPPRAAERTEPVATRNGLRTGRSVGTRVRSHCSLCCYYCFLVPSRRGGSPPVSPAPLLGAPWAAPLHFEPPELAPAHSTIQGGWHHMRREQEAGPRQRQQMGTSWAGSWGGLAAARSGQARQPLPCPPLALRPPASGFSGRQRGQGSLAGLQGWAGGFPLWALFPPGAFPNARQAEERQAHPLLASHHPHHLPLQYTLQPLGQSSPRAFALAVPCLAHSHSVPLRLLHLL